MEYVQHMVAYKYFANNTPPNPMRARVCTIARRHLHSTAASLPPMGHGDAPHMHCDICGDDHKLAYTHELLMCVSERLRLVNVNAKNSELHAKTRHTLLVDAHTSANQDREWDNIRFVAIGLGILWLSALAVIVPK